ncbi:MAG TPA: uracil-DNA glycosylase [candidate division Zixibacteria bacterium]
MNENKKKFLDLVDLTEKYVKQQIDLGFDELHKERKPETKSEVEPETQQITLKEFHEKIKNCTECHLHKARTNFVFGTGKDDADIMFIGEAPGREEDLKGEPFVGEAGKLLNKILAAVNFKREEVYIGNVLKCRPPENREPLPEEIETCEPYLLKQIAIIKPKIICALGRISAQALLKTKLPLNKLRGRFHDYHGRKLLVTYHPAALLRYPQYKKDTWEDIQLLRKEYDKMISPQDL